MWNNLVSFLSLSKSDRKTFYLGPLGGVSREQSGLRGLVLPSFGLLSVVFLPSPTTSCSREMPDAA